MAMRFLISLAVLCLSVACCIGQDTSQCPDAAQSNPVNSTLRVFGGSCLEFVPTRTFWSEAKKDCESRKGRLIEIRSAAMQNFTYQTLRTLPSTKYGIWLGIDDLATQGTWIYSGSGDAPTYSNWGIGQPACFLTGELAKLCIEDCGIMDVEDFGFWDDQYCHLAHLQYTYVCEYVLGGSVVTATPAASTAAPPGTQTAAAPPAGATPRATVRPL